MLEIPDGQTAPQTFTKAFSPSTIGPVGQVRTKNQHAQDHGQEQRAKQWKGLTSIMEGQLEQAVEHLLQALRDEPNNPESHYNLGVDSSKSRIAGGFDHALLPLDRLFAPTRFGERQSDGLGGQHGLTCGKRLPGKLNGPSSVPETPIRTRCQHPGQS